MKKANKKQNYKENFNIDHFSNTQDPSDSDTYSNRRNLKYKMMTQQEANADFHRNPYTFERFSSEAELLVRTLWSNGHIDGSLIIDCTLETNTSDPFLPKEYQKQLKLTVRRKSDDLYFRLSIMYSVVEQIPELFFTCYRKIEPSEANDLACDNIFAE